MRINFLCPACSKENVFVSGEPWEGFRCEHCAGAIHLELTAAMLERNVVEACAVCRKDLFYLQKDFNRTLGISILAIAFTISMILWVRDWVYSAFLVIGAAAAIDWTLFKLWPDVTICYRCHAQYRAVTPNPENRECDLGLVEKYDPLDKSAHAENPAAEWKSH